MTYVRLKAEFVYLGVVLDAFVTAPWVQVWVPLKMEKWLPISRKRHQIGQLDFRSFRLLTDRLQVQILPEEPILFDLKQLQRSGRAFGSRPNACDVKCRSLARKLLKGNFFREMYPESTSAVIKM